MAEVEEMKDIGVVKKWLSLVFAILETFLLGGILFGWASLVYMLKRDGVYSHLCGEPANGTSSSNDSVDMASEDANVVEVGCLEQDRMLQLAFVIANCTSPFANFFIGGFYDRYGLRWSRMSAM